MDHSHAVPSFSCRCLNVQISNEAASGSSSPLPSDDAYVATFAGEEGVRVIHTQFTTRSRGLPKSATSSSGHTVEHPILLLCLLCNCEVYRVWWTYSSTLHGDSSNVIASGVWAEGDILKSRSGWIEVNRACPRGPAVSELFESPSYSLTFQILLPSIDRPHSPSPSPSPSPSRAEEPQYSDASHGVGHSYLPPLPALFLPAPFTPSHPAFIRLSAVATKQSEQLREAAEQHVALVVRQQLAELECAEREMKRQVELIWRTFRDRVRHRKQNDQFSAPEERVRSPTRAVETIRDFQPLPDALPISPLASPAPRPSALAASLRQSSMHFVPKPPGDTLNGLEMAQSVPSDTRRTKWNTGEAANVAVTLKVSAMEESTRRELESRAVIKPLAEVTSMDTPASESGEVDVANIPTPKVAQPVAHLAEKSSVPNIPQVNGDWQGKGRKVKFDAQPQVATIHPDAPSTTELDGSEESIFDFETEDGPSLDGSPDIDVPQRNIQPLPALRRPTGQASSARRNKKKEPVAFSTLRPSSLPAPSHVDRMAKLKDATQALPPQPSTTSSSLVSSSSSPRQESEAVTTHDQFGTGQWPGKDGRSWEIFTRNKGGKTIYPSGTAIEEEDENEPSSTPRNGNQEILDNPRDYLKSPQDLDPLDGPTGGVPRSVPIPIGVLQARRSLDVDYEPKTSLADRPGVRVPKLRTAGMPSSLAIRKANYAARDRQKGTDPGAFDFVSDDTDDDDEDDDDEDQTVTGTSERARQQALRILKARSELPAASMWRSLA